MVLTQFPLPTRQILPLSLNDKDYHPDDSENNADNKEVIGDVFHRFMLIPTMPSRTFCIV